MYTFRTGYFKDLTVAQAMLRDAPRLFDMMKWAREKRIMGLKSAVDEFDILRQKLRKVSIRAVCTQSGCQRRPTSMTFLVDKEGWYRLSPYYWCEKHEPGQRSGISPKHAIHFDAIGLMKTKFEKTSLFKKLRIVFGIAAGTRITRGLAYSFFDELG